MLPQQGGDRCGNGRGRLAETEWHGVAVVDDVVHGEPDDAAQRLRVEENDDAGDAESHRCLRVGQQAPKGGEAFVLAQCGPAGNLHRGDGQGTWAMTALYGPVEEASQAGAGVLGVLGEPGVDVDLAA
ncbi:hypothetical protein [Streptomyces sp. NPDC088725]|uniref:hypothetical protein n=1 Tax=Streptomyces sp. NPDC088725 TaxID=3365873 RepID=UPI00381F410F